MSFKTSSTKRVLNDYPELSESVSDVDSDDIAKILKGADDIDDELFGFPKKSSNESKILKQTSSFDKDKEKSKKVTKSVGFDDFDDSDPLGDLSLSDGDDIYGVSKVDKDSKTDNIGKTDASTKRQMSSSLSPLDSKEKSTKSKLIKDLFGLDNDSTNEVISKDKPMITAERKKDDWLGIKDSPKKPNDSTNLASESDRVVGEVQKEHEDKAKNNSSFVSIQDSVRPATKNNDQSIILKESNLEKDQITAKSSFIGFDASKSNDLFDLLDDSKVNSDDKLLRKTTSANVGGKKKSDLTDELFGTKINTSRNVESANVNSSMTKVPVNETKSQLKDNIIKEPSWMSGESSAVGTSQYKPSSGSARRPGFGRRRDSIPPPSESTPVRVAEDDVIRPSSSHLDQASSDTRVAPSSQTHVNLIENVKPVQGGNTLPPWLGGARKNKEESDVKQVDLPMRSKQQHHATDNDVIEQTAQDVHLIGDVMTAATALSQQSTAVMEETENHLVAVVHMKRQQDMVAELCNRQKQLLDVQRRQIEQLVKQQINRQLKVDQQMRRQQDRINILIQSLITDVKNSASNDLTGIANDGLVKEELHIENDFPVNEGMQEVPSAVSKDRDVVCELETELQKLRIENTSLQQHLKVFEDRHEEEIKRLEQFYRNEIIHWETREDRLRQTQEQLEKDYEARISRLQENELRLIEQHNMRVDNLQKERLVDLTQVGEFHRMAMEQVASVGKLLFENTRVIESKRAIETHQPLDETQLSTRELDLMRKEKQFEALRVNLEKEHMKFADEREELVERLDKERREYEEKLRQLKREQNALKLREEEFVREQERENSLLQMQKKQIEELRTKVLSEQTKAIEDRLQVTASQARLDALARLQGGQDATSISSFDLVQVRAEVEGTLNAAKEERKKAEEEKHKLKQERLSLEAEKWRLQEWEQEITVKSKHVEEMVKASDLKREEGIKAMAEAKLLEKKMEAQNRDFQSQSNDLYIREEALVKEKLELARDKAILERRRAQLDSVLPPLSPSENFTLGITNSNRLIIDPKKLIMKLKAEKELETSSIRT